MLAAVDVAVVPVTRTYIGTTASTTNATTYTFTNHAIGDAAADRLVVVVVTALAAGVTRTLSSLTIGGVSATIHGEAVSGAASGDVNCAVASLLVTSGTTANIVATYSNGMSNCTIHVYTLNAYDSATPEDTGQDSDAAGSLAYDLAVSEGAAIIAGFHFTTTGDITMTGVTEDVDQVTETEQSGAGSVIATADDATFDITGSGSSGKCVSFAISVR